ncbi:hypothetical protein IU479_03250 [Nocardia abscessus]|uniref:hypothetical protein n=1 Tax=Nocardia TaxID=1817 RepID=UPI001894656D|nr:MULTISPECIES: hypothetical protein [Nocardia]MBF6217123.1 hypothetical protein [Nocardia abscessus]MDE1670668.1 hypothetical protein [Nocardia gipuzkoensis]
MVERRIRRIRRAAGLARLLGVLALLAGVVAMHSVIFGSGGHAHATGAHAAPASASDAVSGGPERLGAPPAASPPRPASDHDETGPHHRDVLSPADSTSIGHDRLQPRQATRPDSSAPLRAGEAPIVASDDSYAAQVTAAITGRASWAGTARSMVAAAHIADDSHCAGAGCDGAHSALHGCVFILVSLVALGALVLLYRMAVDRPGRGVARPRHWRPRPERPPPWTVLTRAELAILRI